MAPDAMSQPQRPKDYALLLPFLAVNVLAAIFAPIQDCDEVFNYWEPTHYLNHGFGLQTWEYSPEFAIRSWLYIMLHAVVGRLQWLWEWASGLQIQEFHWIRLALSLFCALSQLHLLGAVSRSIGSRIAFLMALVMLSSTGMFYSSVAYLPSSFSMYTTMMGLASFLDTHSGPQTARGIAWFGIGAVVGWPFSAALTIPLLMDEVAFVQMTRRFRDSVARTLRGVVRVLPLVPLDIMINAICFRRFAFSPWRIVSYNVFSGSARGPDIFGTEPWHFYARNLLLNFNVWFLAAICAGPILAAQHILRRSSTTKLPLLRTLTFSAPFYLWLAIFSLQPHKEERFMYPAYPFLSLNAAITLHVIIHHLGHSAPTSPIGRIPGILRVVIISTALASFAAVGVFRTLGTITAYDAPLKLYTPLKYPEYRNRQASVCLGKEWYRYPSSYFLPDRMRAHFIKSDFAGLLPGQFAEGKVAGFGGLPATWALPTGMNDQNLEDSAKHVNISTCDFLIDSYFDSAVPSTLEPQYVLDTDTWEQVSCSKTLDHPKQRVSDPETPASRRGSASTALKAPTRPFGVWQQSEFKRPAPQALLNWNVHDTEPRQYRPFRWGPYHITMGLRAMQWDEWIELDNRYLKFHADKKQRIEERGKKCCHTAPEAMEGAIELLEELCDYLPQRYPTLFTRTATGITNLVTNEIFDVTARPLREDPMVTCSRLIQDDLAIMFEKGDGQYYLLAGAILLGGFWRLEDKFGMPLSEIHSSGDVPGFKQKLEKGMVNFFRRIQPNAPVLRYNYFIQVDDHLPWSSSIGPEDEMDGKLSGWAAAEKNKAIEHHHFRSERQSLRRLPKSGGVVFTIRTYFEPIMEVAKEPGVPGRLASAIRSWGEDVSKYKGRERWGDILLDFLDDEHKKQVKAGLVSETADEDDRAAYPF
ncbi:uncharacterized protein KY384_007117 [Bacidia gigantensis]|uniref:uncharacterized protein n=1 Tax=Bacidia gigantensis TaxID=2732470 RepID=UPI001D047864|nr:uncharacterized protein KY384_007117 [Bacidia gigantensis]KAG8528200.1 hypothetical protein KY384_007117 [Bacidia gigantensis]